MTSIFFEDMAVGKTIRMGPYRVGKEEIIDFAEQFDPAPFHLDEQAGRESMLGGLAASGWHVCSIAMRMIWDAWLKDAASEGSPGVDECRWQAPVLAGDTLSGELVVETARRSAKRPGIGIIVFRCDLFNQAGTRVLTFTNAAMMRSRDMAGAS